MRSRSHSNVSERSRTRSNSMSRLSVDGDDGMDRRVSSNPTSDLVDVMKFRHNHGLIQSTCDVSARRDHSVGTESRLNSRVRSSENSNRVRVPEISIVNSTKLDIDSVNGMNIARRPGSDASIRRPFSSTTGNDNNFSHLTSTSISQSASLSGSSVTSPFTINSEVLQVMQNEIVFLEGELSSSERVHTEERNKLLSALELARKSTEKAVSVAVAERSSLLRHLDALSSGIRAQEESLTRHANSLIKQYKDAMDSTRDREAVLNESLDRLQSDYERVLIENTALKEDRNEKTVESLTKSLATALSFNSEDTYQTRAISNDLMKHVDRLNSLELPQDPTDVVEMRLRMKEIEANFDNIEKYAEERDFNDVSARQAFSKACGGYEEAMKELRSALESSESSRASSLIAHSKLVDDLRASITASSAEAATLRRQAADAELSRLKTLENLAEEARGATNAAKCAAGEAVIVDLTDSAAAARLFGLEEGVVAAGARVRTSALVGSLVSAATAHCARAAAAEAAAVSAARAHLESLLPAQPHLSDAAARAQQDLDHLRQQLSDVVTLTASQANSSVVQERNFGASLAALAESLAAAESAAETQHAALTARARAAEQEAALAARDARQSAELARAEAAQAQEQLKLERAEALRATQALQARVNALETQLAAAGERSRALESSYLSELEKMREHYEAERQANLKTAGGLRRRMRAILAVLAGAGFASLSNLSNPDLEHSLSREDPHLSQNNNQNVDIKELILERGDLCSCNALHAVRFADSPFGSAAATRALLQAKEAADSAALRAADALALAQNSQNARVESELAALNTRNSELSARLKELESAVEWAHRADNAWMPLLPSNSNADTGSSSSSRGIPLIARAIESLSEAAAELTQQTTALSAAATLAAADAAAAQERATESEQRIRTTEQALRDSAESFTSTTAVVSSEAASASSTLLSAAGALTTLLPAAAGALTESVEFLNAQGTAERQRRAAELAALRQLHAQAEQDHAQQLGALQAQREILDAALAAERARATALDAELVRASNSSKFRESSLSQELLRAAGRRDAGDARATALVEHARQQFLQKAHEREEQLRAQLGTADARREEVTKETQAALAVAAERGQAQGALVAELVRACARLALVLGGECDASARALTGAHARMQAVERRSAVRLEALMRAADALRQRLLVLMRVVLPQITDITDASANGTSINSNSSQRRGSNNNNNNSNPSSGGQLGALLARGATLLTRLERGHGSGSSGGLSSVDTLAVQRLMESLQGIRADLAHGADLSELPQLLREVSLTKDAETASGSTSSAVDEEAAADLKRIEAACVSFAHDLGKIGSLLEASGFAIASVAVTGSTSTPGLGSALAGKRVAPGTGLLSPSALLQRPVLPDNNNVVLPLETSFSSDPGSGIPTLEAILASPSRSAPSSVARGRGGGSEDERLSPASLRRLDDSLAFSVTAFSPLQGENVAEKAAGHATSANMYIYGTISSPLGTLSEDAAAAARLFISPHQENSYVGTSKTPKSRKNLKPPQTVAFDIEALFSPDAPVYSGSGPDRSLLDALSPYSRGLDLSPIPKSTIVSDIIADSTSINAASTLTTRTPSSDSSGGNAPPPPPPLPPSAPSATIASSSTPPPPPSSAASTIFKPSVPSAEGSIGGSAPNPSMESDTVDPVTTSAAHSSGSLTPPADPDSMENASLKKESPPSERNSSARISDAQVSPRASVVKEAFSDKGIKNTLNRFIPHSPSEARLNVTQSPFGAVKLRNVVTPAAQYQDSPLSEPKRIISPPGKVVPPPKIIPVNQITNSSLENLDQSGGSVSTGRRPPVVVSPKLLKPAPPTSNDSLSLSDLATPEKATQRRVIPPPKPSPGLGNSSFEGQLNSLSESSVLN